MGPTLKFALYSAFVAGSVDLCSALSRKTITGMTDTVKRGDGGVEGCGFVGPPEQEHLKNRVEYGDRVRVKLSAYRETQNQGQEYSPDLAEQEVLIGRANVPALNEHLDGMCPGEIRRVFTWLNPKMQVAPIAYIVELREIMAKAELQRGAAEEPKTADAGRLGNDEL